MWILVPYQLWVVNFSSNDEWVNLVSMITTYSLSSFWLKFNFILFNQSILLNHHKLILVIFLTNNLFLFFNILYWVLHSVDLVLFLRLRYCLQHKPVPLFYSLDRNQTFLCLLKFFNVELVMHLHFFLLEFFHNCHLKTKFKHFDETLFFLFFFFFFLLNVLSNKHFFNIFIVMKVFHCLLSTADWFIFF